MAGMTRFHINGYSIFYDRRGTVRVNARFGDFVKGFLHAFSANVIRLCISIILTLFLPKVLGVEEYSYWQLYLFYVTYTAYSSLGFCEGTYLKYGGKRYEELDKKIMASQFWTLAIYEICFGLVCGAVFTCFVGDADKRYLLCLALVSSFFDILRYLLQCVLQATSRIQDFAKVMTAERILFFLFLSILVGLGYRSCHSCIFSEILARIVSMGYGMMVSRDTVFVRFSFGKESRSESKELVEIGFKLLLANLASQLVIGIVRFMIEQRWGTIVFGKVSLTLSLSNMVITCIGAVSIVLFPALKNMDQDKLERLYGTMRMALTAPVLSVLLFYVPVKLVLGLWLPQYQDSLRYLAVIMPVSVYETRFYALINTYFKAYRKENQILFVNVITVLLSLAVSFCTVFLLDSLDLSVMVIVAVIVFKSVLSEWILKNYVSMDVLYDNLLEIALILVFIVSNLKMGSFYAFGIYLVSYMGYLVLRKKEIAEQFSRIKRIVVER